MVLNRAKPLLCFTLFFSLAACQNNPTDTSTVVTQTSLTTSSVVETPPQIVVEQANEGADVPVSEEAAPVSEEPTPAGRTVSGRILNYDGQPIEGLPLQLEPGGEFVTETSNDGRFSLLNLPHDELTVYASHLQFVIPPGDDPVLDLGDIKYPLVHPPILSLADYPPSETPYRFDGFWLVHTSAGQLMAFSPVSPEYDDRVSVEECQFVWAEANQRFMDPCSGDEWELNGRLNLEHSTEMWSNSHLDQYYVSVTQGQIFVQYHIFYPGAPIDEPPLAADSQFGVTLTVRTVDFSPNATTMTLNTQVDPIWGMDPTVFPPQQALSYPTFPDSLVDDQGRVTPSGSRSGGLGVFDPATGGVRQDDVLSWQGVAADAQTVTATLTINLAQMPREISFQPDLAGHQEGDVWPVDMPLEIGHAIARVMQLEWLGTAADGRIRLRLTVLDDSPEGIVLQCLYLSNAPPDTPACANFSNEQRFVVFVPPDTPATLHVRAGVDLVRPFQLVLERTELLMGE